MKNKVKQYSYREAYARMNMAMKNNFHLEAISIQESIITDRLLNFVVKKEIIQISENELHKPKAYLNNLIKISKQYFDDESLFELLDKFRNGRNKCIHAMVKSFPGKPTMSVEEFLLLAKVTSVNGKLMTRKIDAWHKRVTKNLELKNL